MVNSQATRKRRSFSASIQVTVLSVLLIGQTNFASASEIFVTNLIDGSNALPISGNQPYTGQLGDDFTVNNNISITSIGVFDDDGDGTQGDLFWELFNVSTGALIHSQTIGASGTRIVGTSIEDNYLWAQLSSAIDLTAGVTYSAVAYGFDGTDKNFNTNFGLTTLDVVFNTTDLTAAGGRFGGAFGVLPNSTGNSASTASYNFGAATFSYTSSVPEPATLALMGLGLLGLGFSRKRKA